MKTILKLIVGKLFSGLGWLFQSFIEHWKIWVIVVTVGYVLKLNFKVRNLESEVTKLDNTVFIQDSTIVAIRSKYMIDSVNLVLREKSIQNTLTQVNNENKLIKKENAELNQLVSDMKKGLKKVNFFGKIVNDKK